MKRSIISFLMVYAEIEIVLCYIYYIIEHGIQFRFRRNYFIGFYWLYMLFGEDSKEKSSVKYFEMKANKYYIWYIHNYICVVCNSIFIIVLYVMLYAVAYKAFNIIKYTKSYCRKKTFESFWDRLYKWFVNCLIKRSSHST